ncbi:MAG: hypothetical protein Q4D32_08040, partial [Eubacteriales bacterium]|nr:hypothetical protein [Eubacteriales bacterium]
KVNRTWYYVSYKKKKRYVCAAYLKKNRNRYQTYTLYGSNAFKSFEDADYITDSTAFAQGRLKRKYHLDGQSGVWMIGNRYCIAVGSFYTKKCKSKLGVKIDLVLSRNGKKHILRCITADCKADIDTIHHHTMHKDGSVVEFVVKTSMLSSTARKMGDVSYSGKQFKGKITQMRVYR